MPPNQQSIVNRISRLRDCGIFRDFTWPTDLFEFARYNLIYGWNGTGKTTISRVFRMLELRQTPSNGKATLRVNGIETRGQDFPNSTLGIRVFNRDYVYETIFPAGGGDVPPIFVVGKESVEKQKETDRLKGERGTKESELNEASATKQHAERDLDQHCIDRAKVIKDTLRLSGSAYNEYDRRAYQKRAQQMASDRDATARRLSNSQRESLMVQHRATQKPKVSEIAYHLPELQRLADDVSALLRTTVVSAAIDRLKDDSVLAEWVRHGLSLHKERKSDNCLFCERTLPQRRLGELEAHFNAEYERLLGMVEEKVRVLESAGKQAAEVRQPNRAELYDDLATDFDAAGQGLRRVLDAMRGFVDELVNALNDKRAQPFSTSTHTVSVPTVDSAAVDRLNEVIRSHNQACDDFARRVSDARDRLALDMVAESVDEFVRLRDAAYTAKAAIGPIQNQISRLTTQITQLEREIREHQQPAEALNEDLKRYLGHGELQLTIKETGYAITRNGVAAEMLSEGEMTAIALLYFLKSLEDRQFSLSDGVVVMDDPVSSLDQNSLFGAFGYIRGRAQSAGQLIVLTHNFLFFRVMREWFSNLRGADKRAWHVFMLECAFDANGRRAAIRAIDPLLMDFDSEYHHLFSRLYRMATSQQAAPLENYYFAPSIARRVTEMFLAFRTPDLNGHNRLWTQMQSVAFDEAKKSRIYRYMQTHSHRDAIGESDEDLTLLCESRAILNDLLDFMRAADADHISRMIVRVTQAETAETS